MDLLRRHGSDDHMGMDSSSGSSMDGMSGMDNGMGGMMMNMVFQTRTSTPLYSTGWTPQSGGAYAGTCIFLVVLAIVARLLIALRSIQEAKWLDQDAKRRYIATAGKEGLAERISQDSATKQMVLSENGIEESVFVVERKHNIVRPWRFSVDPVRAVMDAVIVGIGYLMMLAVMTMNVGYFMSIIGGVFIGSLAFGRYSNLPVH